MIEQDVIFTKCEFEYLSTLRTSKHKNDSITIALDTGSPFTIISIPAILKLLDISNFSLRKLIDNYYSLGYKPRTARTYGTPENNEDSETENISRSFIPYIIKDIFVGDCYFTYFLFWLDVTDYNKKRIYNTSILLGFDYIKYGKKFFDEEDNFHIIISDKVLKNVCSDIKAAVIDGRVNTIRYINSDKTSTTNFFS